MQEGGKIMYEVWKEMSSGHYEIVFRGTEINEAARIVKDCKEKHIAYVTKRNDVFVNM